MTSSADARPLPAALRDRILDRLGLLADFPDRWTPDLDGLRAVYAAWCRHVTFDNIRKLIALRTEAVGALPGSDAEDFFEQWLAHGVGGTCWPSSNALYALLRALDFDARRVAGSMHDVGAPNHGSVKVRLANRDWLVDSSMLTNAPLRVDEAIVASDDGIVAAEVEPVDDAHLLWVQAPPNERHVPCRIFPESVDQAFYAERYEASRQSSPFNQRIYARRGGAARMIVLAGAARFEKTRSGLDRRDLRVDELAACLRSDFGFSSAIVDQWIACGGVDAAMTPQAGPKPPQTINVPPSLRARRA